jgi:diguanylate cyclase (GGDEF)-like protein/PAS domain S-box-containing protein
LQSIGDAVIGTDNAGRVNYLNTVAENLTGLSCAEALGESLHDVFRLATENTREVWLTPLQAAMEKMGVASGTAQGVLRRGDGVEFAVEHSTAPMHDSAGAVIGAVLVFRDVSAAQAITCRLAYAAQHDALTGLPNRTLFSSRVTQALALALRHNVPAAVLFLDLNDFKRVNDTFGHAAGDRVLESVARRLQHCVRASDTVCRFGGDEFVVLLSEISQPEDAGVCARSIREALSEPHQIDLHSIEISVSVGIGIFPQDGLEAETLLRHADAAMFQVKRQSAPIYPGEGRPGLALPALAVQAVSLAAPATDLIEEPAILEILLPERFSAGIPLT